MHKMFRCKRDLSDQRNRCSFKIKQTQKPFLSYVYINLDQFDLKTHVFPLRRSFLKMHSQVDKSENVVFAL